jgi:hypothetical protein
LSALVFAAQSPYSGRQNVVNSQNVMRNKNLKICEKIVDKDIIVGVSCNERRHPWRRKIRSSI